MGGRMEKQEGARGTERWNRSEREREGATLAPLFLHHSSERFHRSVLPRSFLGPSLFFPRSFPGLSSVLPFSFLGPSQVFPRSFPFLSSVLPRSFLGPSLVFPRSFPGLSSVFPRSFLGPSLVFPRSFLFFSFSFPFTSSGIRNRCGSGGIPSCRSIPSSAG